jgi:hypothetical protein
VNEELKPDIEAWASANGFELSSVDVTGATPLLRTGALDTTDDAYTGQVDGRDAVLAEFSIGSPTLGQEFGGSGSSSTEFTLFLVAVDGEPWPRLTVHPTSFSERTWTRRLLQLDHEISVSPEMDERYRVIASHKVSDDAVRNLLTPDVVAWWLAQDPDLFVDIEDHGEAGAYLAVAHPGLGLSDDDLAALRDRAAHLADLFDPAG